MLPNRILIKLVLGAIVKSKIGKWWLSASAKSNQSKYGLAPEGAHVTRSSRFPDEPNRTTSEKSTAIDLLVG